MVRDVAESLTGPCPRSVSTCKGKLVELSVSVTTRHDGDLCPSSLLNLWAALYFFFSQFRPPSNASTIRITSMSQHVSAALELDLGELGSDGTGQGPSGTTYTQLPDESMLKLLSRAFNNDQARVQHWGKSQSGNPGQYPLTSTPGTEMNFVGSLPRGFSYWSHPTTGGGTLIPEVFGHPRGIRYRSGPDFLRHVDEILLANEGMVRGWLYAIQPNNTHNNNRRLAHPRNQATNCHC
jgi:hypothetical protein